MAPAWAAATALRIHHITNNVAEIVGLRRLLAYAWEKKWTKWHVVGDSALVLGMTEQRRSPKPTKLIQHDKVVDWLANLAMDRGRSYMTSTEEGMLAAPIVVGLKQLLCYVGKEKTADSKITEKSRDTDKNVFAWSEWLVEFIPMVGK
ncbi:reverse transcriptase [Phytophthora megakarya]|uniref:Reverse transcriptase n=1 Tax=Phytophthora megakarya TaxID=4795 RepID=A0A225VSR7_9STRA|nr:reverse transcriptase [Phytophthora megakarya]